MNNINKYIKYCCFFLFYFLNCLYLILLYIYFSNFWLEFFKYLQFYAMVFLLAIILTKYKKINFSIFVLIFFAYYFLVFFYFITRSSTDFLFLKRNITGFNYIIKEYWQLLSIVIIFALFNSFFLIKYAPRPINKLLRRVAPTILLLFFSFFPILTNNNALNNELFAFAQTIIKKDEITDYYQNFYSQLINQSAISRQDVLAQAAQKKENSPYLQNIIIIQLESLNSSFVNQATTPNFSALAEQGVFFPKFYGNSVATILAQENILCSLPSSFDATLTGEGLDKKSVCLPNILKAMGYKNFFLKTYDLNFTRAGEFMKNIGFDQIHADDLMEANDPKYAWGYREDVFFKRAFNYIAKNKSNKNFIYLEIGPTNHWPFNTPVEYADAAPYKNPANTKERLSNTTFFQDAHLKEAWQEINRLFPEKNRTVIILSDHSWPAEAHPGNNFNQHNAYEENFLTSMIFMAGDDKKYKSAIINTKYSQMDIMPSLLGLFNINSPKNNYARSFIDELEKKQPPRCNIILIQPYNIKYINIISGNLKYQYGNDELVLYNLDVDPNEQNGKIISRQKTENLEFISRQLPILDNNHVIRNLY